MNVIVTSFEYRDPLCRGEFFITLLVVIHTRMYLDTGYMLVS